MKNYLLFILVLMSVQGYAQSWCPTGSTWHYSYSSMLESGFVRLEYSGDSLVDGVIAQKINRQRHTYNHLNNTYHIHDLELELTYENEGVVFIRFSNEWDTLYNFNATVGDHWYMSTPEGWNDVNLKLNVVAEGSILLNDEYRNYKVLEGETDYGVGPDTIVEGIGSINGYLHQFDSFIGMIDGNSAGHFRCYSNSNFQTYQYSQDLPCDFIVGIIENEAASSFALYPNPTKDVVNISCDDSFQSMELFNAFGQLLLKSSAQSFLDLGDYERGIYYLRISSDHSVKLGTIILQ